MPLEETKGSISLYLYRKDHKFIGKRYTGSFIESLWPASLKNTLDYVDIAWNDIVDDLDTELNSYFNSDFYYFNTRDGKKINAYLVYDFFFPDELLSGLKTRLLNHINAVLKSYNSKYTMGDTPPETSLFFPIVPQLTLGGKRKRSSKKRRSSNRRKY